MYLLRQQTRITSYVKTFMSPTLIFLTKEMKAAMDILPASLLITDALPPDERFVCVLDINTCCTKYSHNSRAALRQLDSFGKLLLPVTCGNSLHADASRRHSCNSNKWR